MRTLYKISTEKYWKYLDNRKIKPYTFFIAWGVAFPIGNGLSSGRRNEPGDLYVKSVCETNT